MYPGRWNRKGQCVVYTSLSLSTAVLETLALIDKTEIPDNLVKMEIEISIPSEIPVNMELNLPPLPKSSNVHSLISVRQSIAAAKADPDMYNYGRFELGRCIPSVIVPEFNVVLNPAAKIFQRFVKLVSVVPFSAGKFRSGELGQNLPNHWRS
jgi:RES domain-containing protein